MVRRRQTPMYWQNGSYGSKIDHITEHDLMPWSKKEYAKHHSQQSGAFSVAEMTERKDKREK